MADAKKKVAIVTGGSRGIGRGVTLTLAAAGWTVVINYAANEAAAKAVLSEIEEKYGTGKAIAVKGNVSVAADVKNVFVKAEEAFGQVNAVVHLAGIRLDTYPKISETTEEDWDKTITTNTRGTFLVCKEAEKRVASGGRIITCSSNLVKTLLPGYADYIASKAAVEAFTKVLAKELRGKNITANVVSPGPTATEMFFTGKTAATIASCEKLSPLERLGQPEDIAAVVKFLVSEGGGWVNGQVIGVDGGAGIV